MNISKIFQNISKIYEIHHNLCKNEVFPNTHTVFKSQKLACKFYIGVEALIHACFFLVINSTNGTKIFFIGCFLFRWLRGLLRRIHRWHLPESFVIPLCFPGSFVNIHTDVIPSITPYILIKQNSNCVPLKLFKGIHKQRFEHFFFQKFFFNLKKYLQFAIFFSIVLKSRNSEQLKVNNPFKCIVRLYVTLYLCLID